MTTPTALYANDITDRIMAIAVEALMEVPQDMRLSFIETQAIKLSGLFPECINQFQNICDDILIAMTKRDLGIA